MNGLEINNPSDKLQESLRQMYNNIYAATKYEVGEATQDGRGYEVAVTAYPLLSFSKILNDEDGTIVETVTEKASEDISDAEIYELYVQEMCKAMGKELENPEYGEPQTVSMTIFIDNNNAYSIETSDLQALEDILLPQD